MERLSRPTSRVTRSAAWTTWCVLSEGGRPLERGLALATDRVRALGEWLLVTACLTPCLFLVCRTIITPTSESRGESHASAEGLREGRARWTRRAPDRCCWTRGYLPTPTLSTLGCATD